MVQVSRLIAVQFVYGPSEGRIVHFTDRKQDLRLTWSTGTSGRNFLYIFIFYIFISYIFSIFYSSIKVITEAVHRWFYFFKYHQYIIIAPVIRRNFLYIFLLYFIVLFLNFFYILQFYFLYISFILYGFIKAITEAIYRQFYFLSTASI